MKNLSIFTLLSFSLVAAFGSTQISNVMKKDNEYKNIKFEAFVNLVKNIEYLNSSENKNENGNEEIKKEELVINSINIELLKKIKIQNQVIRNKIKKFENKKIEIASNKKRSSKDAEKTTIELDLKIENRSKNQEDLTKYEINNSELITTTKLFTEKIEKLSYEIPNSYSDKQTNLEDSVSIKSSSTIGPKEPKTEIKLTKNENRKKENESKKIIENINTTKNQDIEENNDDLKIYDYSDNNTEIAKSNYPLKMNTQKMDKILYERPLSNTVKNAINREIASKKINKEATVPNKDSIRSIEKSYNNEEINKNIELNDEITMSSSSNKKISIEGPAEAFAKNEKPNSDIRNLNSKIKIVSVNMNTHKIADDNTFEFIPDFDRNERIFDNGMGEINYGYPSSNITGVSSGIINKQGSIPTRIDLLMNNQEQILPSFEESSFNLFLENNGITQVNSIIISLNENILDIDIDTNYQKKLYLDKYFKNTESNKQYLMFSGVKTGNVLIKYKNQDGTSSQKIIYIGENEIFYDNPVFENSKRESIELFNRGLMSQKPKGLNTDNKNLKVFNTSIYSKKSALNVYEIKFPNSPIGERKYLELKNQGNTVFIGINENTKVEVPQNDFIEKIMEFNQVSSLDQRCLVEVNLTKEASDIKVGGKNLAGEMNVETSYLDLEGRLNTESVENSEKIFLLGEQEGIINLFINYTDGTAENLKTYCSSNTFLIEQL